MRIGWPFQRKELVILRIIAGFQLIAAIGDNGLSFCQQFGNRSKFKAAFA
jgi:hypothetical protein